LFFKSHYYLASQEKTQTFSSLGLVVNGFIDLNWRLKCFRYALTSVEAEGKKGRIIYGLDVSDATV
jgi:hypothetical protein